MLYFALITLLISKNAPSLVSQAHRPPDLWPPNSPDLNPVDYRIWCLMQQRLHKTPVRDTIDLKKRLVNTFIFYFWASIPQCVDDEAVDQLRACVKAKGRQFEHLLQQLTGSFQSHPTHITTGSFQSHPHTPEVNTLPVCSIGLELTCNVS